MSAEGQSKTAERKGRNGRVHRLLVLTRYSWSTDSAGREEVIGSA
jgi:hypothetical protein